MMIEKWNAEVCDATEDELFTLVGNTIINCIIKNFEKFDDCLHIPLQGIGAKKWQAYYIAPLQPPTLATFRSWGGSAGAGRVRPAGCKDMAKR